MTPGGATPGGALGRPRLHVRRISSTSLRARELAIAGAPHGALVTADEQTAGRGRQGRSWWAAPGSALLMSLVLRDRPRAGLDASGRPDEAPRTLLPLLAAVAICDAVADSVPPLAGLCIKWPNDVVIARAGPQPGTPPALAKLAGVLVEGRPQAGWAVLGIGVNVATPLAQAPPELRERIASLQAPRSAIEPLLAGVLRALERRLGESGADVLAAWRARDALRGCAVSWAEGTRGETDAGLAEGVDDEGSLLVRLDGGRLRALRAGEVHLVARKAPGAGH